MLPASLALDSLPCNGLPTTEIYTSQAALAVSCCWYNAAFPKTSANVGRARASFSDRPHLGGCRASEDRQIIQKAES
jgi:hypothetical protein